MDHDLFHIRSMSSPRAQIPLQERFKKTDPEKLEQLATGARWRFRLGSGQGCLGVKSCAK